MSEFKTVGPTRFGTGDGKTRKFSVARPGDVVQSANIQSVRKVGWQGDVLLSPRPRTNLALFSNDFTNSAWKGSPSLYIDFLAGIMPSQVSFSRATTATYIGRDRLIHTAAIDEPRFTYDPVTGEALGLLVEGQATNLLQWSEDFTKIYWSIKPVNMEIGVPSPAGTPSFKLGTTGTPGEDVLQSDLIPFSAVSGTFVVSFFIKKASNSVGFFSVRIVTSNGQTQVNFDLDSLADQRTSSSTSGDNQFIGAETEPMNDGWYRCSMVFSVGETSTFRWRSFPSNKSANYYLWGAQLEEGSTPSSYIPTEASQVTRAADNLYRRLGEEFNPTSGTVFVDVVLPDDLTVSNYILQISNSTSFLNTSDSFLLWRVSGSGNMILSQYVGGTPISLNSGVTGSGPLKIAFSYTPSEIHIAVNGVSASMDIIQLPDPERLTTLLLSVGFGAKPEQFRSTIYYPRALSNAELEALTS